MADEQDLVVRFIGLDLLSNIANDVGYGVNRLAGRINSLSATSNAQWMAMQRGSLALQKSMAADNEAMAASEMAMQARVTASQQARRDGALELDSLENAVAQRRSLRASQEIRMTEDVQNAQLAYAATAANSGQQIRAGLALESAEQTLASQKITNDLANESDARRIAAASGQINALKQIENSDMQAAAEVAAQNTQTRAANEGALARERIAMQEAEARIAAQQRIQAAITSAATITVMAGAVMVASAAAIGGAMFYAADHAANFEKQLLLIKTQAGATRTDVDLMRTAILQLAPQFGFTAEQAAEAAFHIESVGIRGTAAIDVLKNAMQGARIGAADLQDTTNMLSVIMASGIVPAGQSAAQTMATLDAIIGQGNIRMEELTGAFRTGLVGAMQVAGVGLRDTGAALATLTDLGFTAATAGTALRSTLTMIAAPTNKATQLLGDLGFTVEEVAANQTQMGNALIAAGVNVTQFAEVIRTQGIEAGLQLLHDKMQEVGLTADEMAATLTKAFGGSRMGSAFKVLFENMYRLDLREKAIAANSSPAIFAQKWADTQALTTTKLAQLESSLNNIVILIGEALMPVVNRGIDAVTAFLAPIGDWINKNQNLIATFAPLVIGLMAAAGVILIVIGGLAIMATAISAIAGAIAAFAGGLAIVIAIGGGLGLLLAGAAVMIESAWRTMSDRWNDKVIPTARALWNELGQVWAIIQNGLNTVQPLFQQVFTDFAQRLTEHGGLWDNATSAFQNFGAQVLAFIKSGVFASLIADLAVGLPGAFRVAIDAAFIFADAIQLGLTTAVAEAHVAVDMMSGNYAQAIIDSAAAGPEIARLTQKMVRDTNTAVVDGAAMFDGTNQKMWQKVYDQTMAMTAKIGTDGTTSYADALTKYQTVGDRAMQTAAAQAETGSRYVGEQMVNGIAIGIDANAYKVQAATSRLGNDALRFIRNHLLISSPSVLFATEVGTPMVEGIISGIDQSAGRLNASLANLMSGGTQSVSRSTVPSIGGTADSPMLQLLTDIRDGIVRVANYVDPAQQRTTATATPGAQSPSAPPSMSTLLNLLYAAMSQADNNRRRGIAAYGM